MKTKDTKEISVLNNYIKRIMELENVQGKEVLNEFLTLITSEYLQAYEQHDMRSLGNLLEEQRGIRKGLTEILRSYTDYNVVVYSKLVQTYNIFNKIFQNESKKDDFVKSMEVIERTYKHMWEVVEYLYKHIHVQHKILIKELGIPASSLTDLMKVLEKADCVERIKPGKFSFYNLTYEGRRYVKERRKGIDEEIIIDADMFRAGSQKIIKNKMENAWVNNPLKGSVWDMEKSRKEEKIVEFKWSAEPQEHMIV